MQDEIMKMAALLEEYSQLDGTEVGEYWGTISHLAEKTYCMSPEFKIAYEAEITDIFNELQTNYEVVEETVTETYTKRSLEYLG